MPPEPLPSAPSPVAAHTTGGAAFYQRDARSRATAEASLDAACCAAARHNWSVEVAPPGEMRAAESETLRRAVVEFVLARKAAQVPPERVIVEIKEALNRCLLKYGYERDQQALRGIALAAFLAAYYDHCPSGQPAGDRAAATTTREGRRD